MKVKAPDFKVFQIPNLYRYTAACHPGARSRHAAAVAGGALLIHGGRSGADGQSPDHDVYALDLHALTWRRLRTVGGCTSSRIQLTHSLKAPGSNP